MDTDSSPFGWLREECRLIKSHGFHSFRKLSGEDLSYTHEGRALPVAGEYGIFLREFGAADMFNGWGNMPEIPFLVYPLKPFRRELLDGRAFVAFGDRGDQHVFFDESMIIRGRPSTVYLLTTRGPEKIYCGFSEWLRASYDWVKARYSPRQWSSVIKGAKPFSKNELRIVDARKNFRWKHVGFSENGDAIFEVRNGSTITLPFLSLGVRDCDDAILVGGVWLDVSDIGPGEKKLVNKDCYKDRIPSAKLVVFDKPDPSPEERERYWEFKKE